MISSDRAGVGIVNCTWLSTRKVGLNNLDGDGINKGAICLPSLLLRTSNSGFVCVNAPVHKY